VSAGQIVTFLNADQQLNLHEFVVSPPTGFRCDAPVKVLLTHDAAAFDVPRGGSADCVFGVARAYVVGDYNLRTSSFRSHLKVDADPAAQRLSLRVAPVTVRYGQATVVSGRLAGAVGSETVDIYEFACAAGEPPKIATLSAAPGGTFSLPVQPRRSTTYEARSAASYIADAAVAVRPLVSLVKAGRSRYEARVTAKDADAAKLVSLQRWSGRRWSTLQRAPLKRVTTSGTPIQASSISIARFKMRLPSGIRLRAYLPRSSGGTCYAAAASPSIRS
jgi:hypothetical protein